MNSSAHKRYLAISLACVIAALGAMAALNVLVDPVGAYPRWHLSAFEPMRYLQHDRVPKAELARRGDWQVIVVGSSRAKGGFPAAHPSLAARRTCNLSVDAARFSELAQIIEYARKENPLEEVLLGLDFYMFSKGPEFLLDFPESRFSPRFDPFLYHCKQLFSESALAGTWEALRRKASGFVPEAQSSYGFYNPRIPEGVSQRDLFDRTLRTMGAGYSLQSVDPALVEQLRTVVRACRDHNIGLKLAILPVHALDLELLYADGRWEEFEGWKTSLAHILAEEGVEERFPLWDFTGYGGPAAEPVPPPGDTNSRMRYYFENSHFTPLLGGQILDALCGSPTNQFGAKLTCATVKEHLARILEDRAFFARTQAAEVEWIQQILSEVSKKRKPLQVGAR